MANTRLKNVEWKPGDENGGAPTWERVGIAVLLDIRDELQTLNRLLSCPNFTEIPRTLRSIRKNTTRPKPKRKAATR